VAHRRCVHFRLRQNRANDQDPHCGPPCYVDEGRSRPWWPSLVGLAASWPAAAGLPASRARPAALPALSESLGLGSTRKGQLRRSQARRRGWVKNNGADAEALGRAALRAAVAEGAQS